MLKIESGNNKFMKSTSRLSRQTTRSRRTSKVEIPQSAEINDENKKCIIEKLETSTHSSISKESSGINNALVLKKRFTWSKIFKFPSFKSTKKETPELPSMQNYEQSSIQKSIESISNDLSLSNEFSEDSLINCVGNVDLAKLVCEIASKYSRIAEKVIHINGYKGISKPTSLLCGSVVSKMPIAIYLGKIVALLNKIYDGAQKLGVLGTGAEILITSSIYIDRVLKENPEFVLCPLNIHRTLFAGIMAAIKFTQDRVPDKNLMATIGGVDPVQSQTIESRFCGLINFRFFVSDEELQNQLNNFCLSLDIQPIIIREKNTFI